LYDVAGATPEETLEAAYQQIRQKLEAELLAAVAKASPRFFEKLVVELLVKMGYGGTLEDAGRALGRSHDGGIDGIIKEDHLGLDAIYIQAKRWQNTVGRPDVQAFAGSLQGERAKKGVFITTSGFSKEAREFASRIDAKIVLIDGSHLASLMVDFGIGVNTVSAYEIKRVDSDYFSEE
jgi:restriction system protein